MSSTLANRWFPIAATSVTVSVYAYYRANEGVGAYANNGSLLPNLAIVFPTGSTGGVPAEVVRELIVQHVDNFVSRTLWNPRAQTPLAAIRGALERSEFGTSLGRGGSSVGINLYFDGQFGDVYVG